MPKIDFTKVKDSNFILLPAGQYKAFVAEITPKVSKKKQEMWQLEYEIESGSYAGIKIRDYLVFTEMAMWKIKKTCSRCGLNVSGILNLTPEMLIDQSTIIVVDVEDYVNKYGKNAQRNKIIDMLKIDDGSVENPGDSNNFKDDFDDVPPPDDDIPPFVGE